VQNRVFYYVLIVGGRMWSLAPSDACRGLAVSAYDLDVSCLNAQSLCFQSQVLSVKMVNCPQPMVWAVRQRVNPKLRDIYMFEQELYNAEPAEKPQEGDLFYNYERTNWDIGPRIYKILAFSAVLNLAVLGFIAQSDVLTRRGCDSPWVGRVCQVLDMAYVGSGL